ncbi:FAD binding domain-containing protein [Coprinopsis cinerea okayama7|uniref:FAD binding domain-containing protein n=1 Tax=Coprinopsis cinerea (strain Okayama-7 / 130 / ATCC MYA-4618 / FGSC 9003) TaxID=240176 RepID=A8NQC7_COPC7|nr:FAD binding domain-containing protein [Coprinopsis cinerea okayama7\|eukprot:XP_001835527.2 FAD binding domain-containing protein [Coprinopsis cinerea okayama7\
MRAIVHLLTRRDNNPYSSEMSLLQGYIKKDFSPYPHFIRPRMTGIPKMFFILLAFYASLSLCLPGPDDWGQLSVSLGGRLQKVAPFAASCFVDFHSTECREVRSNYRNQTYRTHTPNAYIQTQWETCQSTEEQCLLDSEDPDNITPTLERQCSQGSVPQYFIDVESEKDVQVAFEFARRTGIPLAVRNTGHDYIGRSSGPSSLGLWAGVQWFEAYSFAEANNITLAGAGFAGVSVVGGWLQGGGHGPLANTMGLGADRVLQFKVVTPDGQVRTANHCQNEDLFFALRGGGAGTFGVVMEATILASPPTTIQSLALHFETPNITRTSEAWSILAENGLKWADDGWGGYSFAGTIYLVNPKLDAEEAASSLAPLIEFGERIMREGTGSATLLTKEYPTFGSFYAEFSAQTSGGAPGSRSLAMASRLVNKANFRSPEARQELVSALLATDEETPVSIIIATPASVPSDGKTSFNDAWRDSLYLVVVDSSWNWNSTKEEISAHYETARRSIGHIRRITPDAAYINEADIYEPNFEESFWGTHYDRLLAVKKKYDPGFLLDCWHCGKQSSFVYSY